MAAPFTTRTTLALLLSTVALAACGSSEPSTVTQGSIAPPPPGEIVVVNHGLDHPPPQDESTVLAPAGLKADETTIAIQSPPLQEGVPEPLTTQATTVVETVSVTGESSRLAQLEKEVAALRADYNAMMPAFNGLITTNERIKTLLDQLEQKAGVSPAPAPAAATPAAVPASAVKAAPQPQAAATPAPTTGAAIISGMRIGEHGEKTRLVLDASAVTEYKTDVNNADKTLVISLPAAGWSGKETVAGLKSPLVSGWTASSGPSGGTLVTISLKSAAKVVATEHLKAEGGASPRIVIDIAADKAAS